MARTRAAVPGSANVICPRARASCPYAGPARRTPRWFWADQAASGRSSLLGERTRRADHPRQMSQRASSSSLGEGWATDPLTRAGLGPWLRGGVGRAVCGDRGFGRPARLEAAVLGQGPTGTGADRAAPQSAAHSLLTAPGSRSLSSITAPPHGPSLVSANSARSRRTRTASHDRPEGSSITPAPCGGTHAVGSAGRGSGVSADGSMRRLPSPGRYRLTVSPLESQRRWWTEWRARTVPRSVPSLRPVPSLYERSETPDLPGSTHSYQSPSLGDGD